VQKFLYAILAVYINAVDLETQSDGRRTVNAERFPGSLGVTYELCAGIVDKDKPALEIAREEVLEECGYQVPQENITRVTGFRWVFKDVWTRNG